MEAGFVDGRYWQEGKLLRGEEGCAPILTFLGSQRFGYVRAE